VKDGEKAIPLVQREPVRGTFPPPLVLLSGLRYTDAGLGTATVAMPASPWWQSAAGVFPAGVLGFVADSALAGAVISAVPPNTIISTSEISLNFLRPTMSASGTIIGRGRLIHSTR
jgi:acyl-coenzyme A thioesterase PaaI-like protein